MGVCAGGRPDVPAHGCPGMWVPVRMDVHVLVSHTDGPINHSGWTYNIILELVKAKYLVAQVASAVVSASDLFS